jgi:hypothetical protein
MLHICIAYTYLYSDPQVLYESNLRESPFIVGSTSILYTLPSIISYP